MLYITGDTHGRLARFSALEKLTQNWSASDCLIIAGDFGYIWGDIRDDARLDYISALPYQVAFVDGNHECFPNIYSYPEEDWCGGRVHRIRPNLVHLMRGQVYKVEGYTIFTMGGGFSVDAALRLPGRSWWSEELPTEEAYTLGLSNLARHDNQVDFIISHTAPINTLYMLQQMKLIDTLFREEAQLNNYLQLVSDTVSYRHHYFGHLHLDKTLWRNQTALLDHVYCLNTSQRVW